MTPNPARPETPVLDVRGLRVSISGDEGRAQVLDNIDLSIAPGRIVGVVGESGCGKSTVIRAVLRVLPRGAEIERGSIRFGGEDLLGLGEREMARRIRGRAIGFIPQDPYLALNPVFRVGTQLLEIMRWHATDGDGESARRGPSARKRHRERLVELLRIVQVPDPESALERYPHQFSGGQRQRLLIAGALACEPRLVIADEPTTALDVTTQLEILKLLRKLSREFDVSMLFVTHDFGVVAQLCDEVNVIYAGQSVEAGGTVDILESPRHPYTRALLACHPDHSDDLTGIAGAVPSPLTPPPGCRFHPRCESARASCRDRRPARMRLGSGHSVDCVLYAETEEAAPLA